MKYNFYNYKTKWLANISRLLWPAYILNYYLLHNWCIHAVWINIYRTLSGNIRKNDKMFNWAILHLSKCCLGLSKAISIHVVTIHKWNTWNLLTLYKTKTKKTKKKKKKIEQTKQKSFVPKQMTSVFKIVENVGKWEIDGFQHFLFFPQCFQKASPSGSLKVGLVW